MKFTAHLHFYEIYEFLVRMHRNEYCLKDENINFKGIFILKFLSALVFQKVIQLIEMEYYFF